MKTLKEDYTVEIESFTNEEEKEISIHDIEAVQIKSIEEIAKEVKENPDYTPSTDHNNHEHKINQARADILNIKENLVPLSLRQRNQNILFEKCGLSVKLPKKLENAFLNIDSYAKN